MAKASMASRLAIQITKYCAGLEPQFQALKDASLKDFEEAVLISKTVDPDDIQQTSMKFLVAKYN